MIEFLYEYGLFLAKTITIVLGVVAVIAFAVNAIRQREFMEERPRIKIKNLNDTYDNMERQLKSFLMSDSEWKRFLKQEKKDDKAKAKKQKKEPEDPKKRVFVLDFEGDVGANQVDSLRKEITAILTNATEKDEVIVRLESGGGTMVGYGLGASQLQRIRERNISLTVSVDKVAASGGYMMACVADKLVAAPFAIVGSIGVIAEMPNINRLLKKLDIDYEQITAGEFKRTLTVFGENTPKGREKLTEELNEMHGLFKTHVVQHRPELDIEKLATGEIWFGVQAVDLKLVDELITSDDWLLGKRKDADILKIEYHEPTPWQEKIALPFTKLFRDSLGAIWKRLQDLRLQ